MNLGLRKMAEAGNTHDYWQLSRVVRWCVESEAIDQALAAVVTAQEDLPVAGRDYIMTGLSCRHVGT
ncbi:hypothetical protein FHY02_003353 [Sphingomonas sp. BK069]|nr:hypothetical protein [Sphingomonas sp. BK069]